MARIVDLVGYGTTANFFEGAGAGADDQRARSSALRDDDGCQDTDDNANDFATAAPDPRNTTDGRHAVHRGDQPPTVASSHPEQRRDRRRAGRCDSR